MWLLITVPFVIQAIAIGIDEYYFHLRRGLPRWERIGHPIDTFSMLLCLLFALFAPFSSGALKVYIILAVLSCLMVTKDEFVHKHECEASEHWLHALLFLNHPIVLGAMGLIWAASAQAEIPSWLTSWLSHPSELRYFLIGQGVFITGFLLYQVIYWNFIWKEKRVDLS